MNNKLIYRQKANIRIIILLLLFIFIALNAILNIVNRNFRDLKIKEENQEIVELTTYLIEDNNLNVAFEFLEHFKDSHHVEFTFTDDDGNYLFRTTDETITEFQETITIEDEIYIISVDNTQSTTVDLLNQNIYYSNLVLLLSSLILVFVLVFFQKNSAEQITDDVEHILNFIDMEEFKNVEFSYEEFENIYNHVITYINKIDLLTEQKHLSITGLAHDIKTPLTIIKSYVSPYKNNNLISKEKCLKAIDKITRLIDYLQQDDYAGAFYDLNFSEQLRNEIESYKPMFTHKGIDIVTNIEDDIHLRWTKKQLSIILDNMFSNAFHYSTENSKYFINLKTEDDQYILQLESLGNPIAQKDVKAIFEKGYRGASTQTLNTAGEGIGLYIVKILLLQIDAKINLQVNSDSNLFTISIPKNI